LAAIDSDTAREVLDFAARVRLPTLDLPVEWAARVVRLSDAIDPATRTVGVVVAVDEPYRQARPGVRPPLIKGLFVEVELRGAARPDRVVVPAAALHEDRVYLIDADNRLRRQAVDVAFRQPGYALIGAGLSGSERLVVSDVTPAIDGQLLEPVADPDTLAQLRRAATGEAP
ncbi:MAG: hypothetical protein R3202_11590, partial [Candidatus Competibacterales bacterium]|nr:hypothetical protein [Candidatus Competibacterales bacterium]